MSCFGRIFLDNGQSRVPEPPARMTGMIMLFSLCFKFELPFGLIKKQDLKKMIEAELKSSIEVDQVIIKPELMGGVFIEMDNFIQLDGSHKQRFYTLYDYFNKKMIHLF